MDLKLLAWGLRQRRRSRLPPLWLFTDERRLRDPLPAVARLPRGAAGVVLRHDGDPHRLELGLALRRVCRARRLVLVVAGDARLAARLGAGVHLRGGRRPGVVRLRPGFVTSSAHGPVELRRARHAGASLALLSPAFPTASHPGARALGAARWSRAARSAGFPVGALGGITGGSVARLAGCRAVGAIGALAWR